MALTLYYMAGSPPCHQVLLTLRALNLAVNLKRLNLKIGDHLSPEFTKINLQHTVPTLVENGFTLWESRSISRYLVNKYGAGSSLYPQDIRARAVVDQRLDFDIGTLYLRFGDYFFSQVYEGKDVDETKLRKVQEALGFLDSLQAGNRYVAGPARTIADFSVVASIAAIEASGINLKPYTNITRWYDMMKTTTPGYEDAVEKNMEVFSDILRKIMAAKAKRKQSL